MREEQFTQEQWLNLQSMKRQGGDHKNPRTSVHRAMPDATTHFEQESRIIIGYDLLPLPKRWYASQFWYIRWPEGTESERALAAAELQTMQQIPLQLGITLHINANADVSRWYHILPAILVDHFCIHPAQVREVLISIERTHERACAWSFVILKGK